MQVTTTTTATASGATPDTAAATARLRRAAGVMARLGGLVTVSILAGGCALLPSSGRGGAVSRRDIRPELHETAPNDGQDCIALVTQDPVASHAGRPDRCGLRGVRVPGRRSSRAVRPSRAPPGRAAGAGLRGGGTRRGVATPAADGREHAVRRGRTGKRRPRAGACPAGRGRAAAAARRDGVGVLGLRGAARVGVRHAGRRAVCRPRAGQRRRRGRRHRQHRLAVEEYDIPLIVVLGHADCGILHRAIESEEAVEGMRARSGASVPPGADRADRPRRQERTRRSRRRGRRDCCRAGA